MSIYSGSKNISKIYIGTQNTNCLTYIPQDIKLEHAYTSWTQPTLTANGTVGGSSYAVRVSSTTSGHDAYKAFNGTLSNADDCWEAGSRTLTDWLEFYSPYRLKVSKITFKNRVGQYFTTYSKLKLTASLDGSSYDTIAEFAPGSTTESATWEKTFSMSKSYRYFRLSAGSDAGYVGHSSAKLSFGELVFTATKQDALKLKAGSKVYVPNGTTGQTETTVTKTEWYCYSEGYYFYYFNHYPPVVGESPYTCSEAKIQATTSKDLISQTSAKVVSVDNSGFYFEVLGTKVLNPRYPSGDLTTTTTEIVPSGDKIFKEVVISSDLTKTETRNGSWVLMYDSVYDIIRLRGATEGSSGNTIPTSTTYQHWYDTANNKIGVSSDSGSTWQYGVSFPLALVTTSNGCISSIDQVFNGFGYMGSTLYGLPGVEYLVPDGLNPDGTYKVIKSRLNKVTLKTFGHNPGATNFVMRDDGYLVDKYFYSQTTQPDVAYACWYNPETNIVKVSGSDKTVFTEDKYAYVFDFTDDNASPCKITSLTPRAVQAEKIGRRINFIYKGSTRVFCDVPSKTFNASSSIQTYTVPNGATKLHIDCVASQGGNSGGLGGRVECDLNVTSGETLYIMVGAVPSNIYTASYNASDIRIGGKEYSNRVIVAGGGGSQSSKSKAGGAGGGLTGGSGTKGYGDNSMGKGGTQTAGGAGGAGTSVSVGHYHNGEAGTFGLGGNGSHDSSYEGDAGAGGAGWYGGGAGAGDWNKNGGYTAGGGGGSSYTDSSKCTNVKHTQGYRTGAGYITISVI